MLEEKFLNKKAAIELSVGTIVIIVLGVSMLILGILLVRNIFSFTTDSVDTIGEKTKQELNSLFGDEKSNVVVRLGPQSIAKIKPGSSSFGIAIAATTPDGSATNRERLQYKITLEEANSKNCLDSKYLGKAMTENLFKTELDKELNFDSYDGANSYAIIQLDVPKGTSKCTQKVFLDVTDKETNQNVGGSFFIIEIIKGGLF